MRLQIIKRIQEISIREHLLQEVAIKIVAMVVFHQVSHRGPSALTSMRLELLLLQKKFKMLNKIQSILF
jgi:hypothetical protein